MTALRQSASGRLVKELGAGADVELCARTESSTTVPILQQGTPLSIAAYPSRELAAAPPIVDVQLKA